MPRKPSVQFLAGMGSIRNAHPRVVTILKKGYCLNFVFQPPLTNYRVIRSKYSDREKQQFLIRRFIKLSTKK